MLSCSLHRKSAASIDDTRKRSMAVYKRKGSDIYYMDFTFYHRSFFKSTGKTDKEEAREAERRERQNLHRQYHEEGWYFLSDYIPARKHGRSKKHSDMRLVFRYTGDKPISLVTDNDIDRLINRLERKAFSKATINKYLSVLRKALRNVQLYHFVKVQAHVPPRLPVDRRERILSVSEEARLFHHFFIHGHRDIKDIVLLLLNTGIKLSEALSRTIDEVLVVKGGAVRTVRWSENQPCRIIVATIR
jgi:integrase